MMMITMTDVSGALTLLNVTGLVAVVIATLLDRVVHGRPYVIDPRTNEVIT
jgi:hypothetical protein